MRFLPLLLGILAVGSAQAAGSPNDFGGLGLLQNPSARFGADGDFRIGVSTIYPHDQLFTSLQFTPWLEAGVRYVRVRNRLYGAVEFSGTQSYKDRGVDLKLRLLEEGPWLPALAFGIRDLGGTGLFSSEYLVASRRIYDFDVSLGLGWGRLGARGGIENPFASLAERFESRPTSSEPGSLSGSQILAGPEIGLFGGVQWQTPLRGLSLKVEYDGNDYQSEALDNDRTVKSPLNFSADYRLGRNVEVALGLERGDEVMFRLNAVTNFSRLLGPPKLLDPRPTPPRVAAAAAPASDARFHDALRAELARQRISLQALDLDRGRGLASAWFSQELTLAPARAVGRVAQSLAALAPPEFGAFTIIERNGDIDAYRVTVFRKEVEAAQTLRGSVDEIMATTLLDPPQGGLLAADFVERARYPAFSWGMGPALRQHVGGPESFYFAQLWWKVYGGVAFTPRWSASGMVGANIYNNFDDLHVASDSVLPHVRSDIVQYLKEGENNLVRLETNYIWSPSPGWYTRLSGGLFEEMYGGVAGEVLYRPFLDTWAVGLDLNRVRQRDYDQRLSFRDYEVWTGHLTGYFEFPAPGYLTRVSAGRYLARDVGVTVDFSREFRSGVRVGVFATKTDVSAEEFGEGQFDKGFYIYVPLDAFFVRSTRRGVPLVFRPLTRDGGQRVRDGIELYGVSEAGNLDGVAAGWDRFLE